MKKTFAILIVLALLLGLCACGDKEPAPSTTTTAPVPTTVPEPGCVHRYADADCITPKTCTLCGMTRGSALGHDYLEGICQRCGKIDATYVALTDGTWRADAVSETGSQLEMIRLTLREDGTAMFAAGVYDRLSDVPADQREPYMEDEENWYDYSGEVYYYAGFGVNDTLLWSAEGDIITCTLMAEDAVVGTLILERTAGNVLTVTYFEGPFSIVYLQVGDVLSNEQ